MWLIICQLVFGLLVLVWGADRFTDGCAAIAFRFNIRPFLIGLTIVALGTSAPEIGVSALAALKHSQGIALGNVLGSNIANIGLVLGITALLAPLNVDKAIFRREYPILLATMALLGVLFYDGWFGQIDGIILLICLILYFIWLVYSGFKQPSFELVIVPEKIQVMKSKWAIFWVILGLIALLLGAHFLVVGGVSLAQHFGVSDLVIGLSVIAIGTSLPEIAAAVASAMKGHSEIALGNILGSNIYNSLAVLLFPAFIHPAAVENKILWRDYPLMLALSIILMFLLYLKRTERVITRLQGVLLLLVYFAYIVLLFVHMQI